MTENTVLDKNTSSIIKFKDRYGKDYPEWNIIELGKLATLKNGIAKGSECFGHGKKFVNLQDVFGKIALYNDEYELVEVTEKELSENNLLKGDVLFIRSSVKPSGVGLPCVIMEDMKDTVFSGFIIRCRFINNIEIDINYKKYCFLEKDFRKNLLIRSSSSANTNINQDNLSVIKVKLPCVEEQEKIASFLTSIDNLISTQESNISILETYNRGLISKIFKQEIRFKDANGNEFPDWEEKNLIEVCNFINGKAHENAIEEKGTYIVVNSKFISSDGTVKKYSNAQIVPLYKNDIVMVMSDVPNGKAIAKCYLIDCNNKFTLNQRICALRTNQNPYFIKMQVNRNPYYLKFDDGVKQTNLRKEDVLKCPLQLPCLEEQEKIANFLTSLDTVLQEEKNYLEYLKTIKKGLLQQMFV